MSFQPQQQQQQPVQVYPNTVTNQTPSSHSNGSFGTVFIVLAVIVVISSVACFLGRLCNKRYNSQKPSKQNNHVGPMSRPKEADIEFGLDKRIPTGKPVVNGDSKRFGNYGGKIDFGNGGNKEFGMGSGREFGNGGNREFRMGSGREFGNGGNREFGKGGGIEFNGMGGGREFGSGRLKGFRPLQNDERKEFEMKPGGDGQLRAGV